MNKVETIVNQLCDFIPYVDSFYNEKNGIYPIKGLTNSMIIKATQKYINSQSENILGVMVIRQIGKECEILSSLTGLTL